METIFIYPVKVLICSAIFFGYYFMALRNNRFHFYNRFYLLFAFVASVIIPFLHFEWFYLPIENTGTTQWLQDIIVKTNVTAANPWDKFMNIETLTTTMYLIVTLILLFIFTRHIVQIYVFRKRYGVQKMGDIDFINTDIPQAPFSFLSMLFWRKDISIHSKTGRQIIKHELSHIHQKHTWDKLFVQSLQCLYWYNPFFYFMRKELSLVHEFIADEKSVGEDGVEAFAEMMLEANFHPNIFSPAQSFFYSPIKRRIIMLTTSKKPRYSYLRRLFVLPVLAVTVLLFAFKMKQRDNTMASDPHSKIHSISDTIPYYGMYDGKKVFGVKVIFKQQMVELTLQDNTKKTMTVDEAKKLNIQLPPPPPAMQSSKLSQPEITSVEISNNAFTDKKTLIPNQDMISIQADTIYVQKENDAHSYVIDGNFQLLSKQNKNPLYVLNGIIISADELKNTSPIIIQSINVLKGESAIQKYGDKGSNGVIEMFTKEQGLKDNQSAETVENSKDLKGVDVRTSEVANETSEAHFPGGNDAWIKYLQRNLNMGTIYKAHAPNGTYNVVVSFLVDEKGNIQEIKALNDPGFGTAAEAVRVIQQGPKWIPAEENGKKIKFPLKQTIRFIIN
ncbi:MAG: energy transducer TonB [Bacteroidetes bacterium]|nr:energy transducer TonB [Bacteroidota bacterium]